MRPELRKLIVIVTVSACTIAALAAAAIGVERYRAARDEAAAQLTATVRAAEARLDEASDLRRTAAAMARMAHGAVTQIGAQVLPADAPKRISTALEALSQATSDLAATSSGFAWRLDAFLRQMAKTILWPPAASAAIRDADFALPTDAWSSAAAELKKSLADLKAAHRAWQAEQARIAAENARRQSAQHQATASPSSQTTSNVAANRARVEAVIRGYEPRARIDWKSGLCSGNHVCGLTTIGRGNPVVHLDPSRVDRYLSRMGTYVLVHEAAHARSWFLYGSVAELYRVSSALMTDGRTGSDAAEYMADCATIVAIGYSAGTYTSRCSAAQRAEAARYW